MLTIQQNDSLAELINIAFSRAASSLSDMTSRRVEISAPVVDIMKFDDLPARLSKFVPGNAVIIQQVFTGSVSGDALLIFEQESAKRLVSLLTDMPPVQTVIDGSLVEVLTEIGNILLNACLGMFGNLLDVRVSFEVPRLFVDTASAVLKSIENEEVPMSVAMIASTAFLLENSTVKGYLVTVLSTDSMDRLVHALEKLG